MVWMGGEERMEIDSIIKKKEEKKRDAIYVRGRRSKHLLDALGFYAQF